jgi:hypothetical protein
MVRIPHQPIAVLPRLFSVLTFLVFAASVVAAPDDKPDAAPDEEQPKPRDLGPPLVDHIGQLKRLQPSQPVWLDAKRKEVVFQGEVCRANYPLEFLVTLPGREYESVIVSRVRPSVVHAGLLAVGAQPGSPVRFRPKFHPPTGTEIEIQVRWKDKEGKRQQARAQDWLRDIKTKKSPDVNWIFGGSGFSEDDGKRYYQADAGDFISVSNVPIATLDLPIESGTALESRLFEGFTDRLPPTDTPVTVILKPKLTEEEKKQPPATRSPP